MAKVNVIGVQVDLLIQTPKSAYVIEVKRHVRITGDVEREVQEKVARIPFPRGISVRTVLVHEGEVAPEVEEDGYFDFIIPIEQLMR